MTPLEMCRVYAYSAQKFHGYTHASYAIAHKAMESEEQASKAICVPFQRTRFIHLRSTGVLIKVHTHTNIKIYLDRVVNVCV